MVTRDVQQTADSIENILDDRSIAGLVTVAGSTAGGIFLAQRIADRVLPEVGLSPDPTTLTDAAGAAALKGGGALATGFAATNVSGLPQVVLAFGAVGMLASAGVDLVGAFTSTPELNQTRARTSSRSRSRARATQTRTVRKRSSSDSSGQKATATGGSNF